MTDRSTRRAPSEVRRPLPKETGDRFASLVHADTTTIPSMLLLMILPSPAMSRSETGHLLQLFGVSALHRDLRGGAIELPNVIGRKFDGSRSDVLSRRASFSAPGIGTIHGFWARSQASAI